MQRTTAIFIIFSIGLGLVACRKTWSSRLGIPAQVYQQNSFNVFTDEARGDNFLIVPQATSAERFAVIGDAVFALENADSRVYRMRGITPGAEPRPGAVRAEPRFFETLDEALADLGEYGVSTTDGVEWHGKAPGGPATIVAVEPGQIESDSVDIVSAVGTWEASGATWFGDAPGSGHLVLVEGSKLTARPVVARLGREARAVSPTWTTNVDGALPPADEFLFASRVSPFARRAGAELYVTIWFDRVYIGSTEPIQSRGVPYLLGSNPLGVGGTASEVAQEMRGLDALLRRKPLAAVGFFDAEDFDIHESFRAAEVGLLELLAEGGYLEHVRRQLLEDGPMTGIRRSVYARMLHRAGKAEARAEGAKAYEELLNSNVAAAIQASGETAMFVARIDAGDGNWKTAAAVARQAAENFKSSGDAIRQAEAELFAGEAALMAGDKEAAASLANNARSRFYHANSPYLSALAEISLAYLYVRSGDSEQATTMADYARRRFVASGDKVAANRATIALARVNSDAEAIRRGLETAVSQGDQLGALDAAVALVERDGVPTGEERMALAIAMAHGFPHTTEPIRLVSAGAAAEKICVTRGEWIASVKPEDAELVSAMCGASVDLAAIATAPPVDATAIYQKLLRGQFKNASRMTGEFADDDLDFEPKATLAMADLLANDATAESAHGATADAARKLDPKRRWSALNDAADRAERVGAHELAIMWGAHAIESVKGTNVASPAATRAEVARQHVARLLRLRRPLEASNTASRALVGMAAVEPGELRAAAVLAGYGAVAAATAGAEADVRELTAQVDTLLEGLPPFELAEAESALAWYAAHHGELELATQWGAQARAATKKLTSEERSATMVARLAVVDARAAMAEGNDNSAFKSVSIWFDNPGDDADVATDLWEIALATAPNAGLRDGLVKRLGDAKLSRAAEAVVVRDGLVKRLGDAKLSRAAEAVVVRNLMERGAVAEAVRRHDGRDIGANPSAALSLQVRLDALAGETSKAQVTRLAQTTRDFDIGLIAATQFSDDPLAQTRTWAERVLSRRGTPADEQKRAQLLVGLSTPAQVNSKVTNKLQAQLESALEAREGEKVVQAVAQRVEDLVATGRAEAAKTVLERNSAWFSKTSPESTDELARLQLAAQVGGLELISAMTAATEPPRGETEAVARFELLAAQTAFALGLTEAARASLQRADTAARTVSDGALIKAIEKLSATFDVAVAR